MSGTPASGTEPAILLVEDEPQMRRFLRAALSSHGYSVIEAPTAAEAMKLVTTHQPALVLLDLGLPDAEGLDVARELRSFTELPIIVVSARGREDDKVLALDAGADDYLTKPFGTNELLARIRVALRHADARAAGRVDPRVTIEDLEIDLAARRVSRGGVELHLTPIEWKLLAALAKHQGKVLTHRQLLADVWGGQHGAAAHHVRVHMAELRKKVEPTPARPRFVLTEPGVGYRLKA